MINFLILICVMIIVSLYAFFGKRREEKKLSFFDNDFKNWTSIKKNRNKELLNYYLDLPEDTLIFKHIEVQKAEMILKNGILNQLLSPTFLPIIAIMVSLLAILNPDNKSIMIQVMAVIILVILISSYIISSFNSHILNMLGVHRVNIEKAIEISTNKQQRKLAL
ncbi:hypothetical protein [Paenibacillus lautus]|uniref:hypothetical protein n=1 Tax=Paenibacillus lautus TaxID=1401 RepID=UPI003D2E42E3